MYTACNESKSAVATRFIKTLKVKIYNIMIPYDRKFYLGYLDKVVDQCYNSYHRSIGKKKLFKMIILLRYFLAKSIPKISQKKYRRLILCHKIFLGRIKLKI